MNAQAAEALVRAFQAGAQATIEIIQERMQEGDSALEAIDFARQGIAEAEFDTMVVIVESVQAPPAGTV